MTTNQPKWVCAANLGDVNPLEYGGKFLLIDATGIYDPELWVYEEWSEEDPGRRLYRIILERCFPIEGGHVGDNVYHSYMPAWFGKRKDLKRVEDFADHTQLVFDLCSSNAIRLAQGYISLIGFYGAHEFDEYHQTLTTKQARVLCDRMLASIKSKRVLHSPIVPPEL